MGLETAVIVSLVGTAVGGVVSAVGARQAAAAEADRFRYEQQVAARNETIAAQDRITAIRTSQIESDDKKRAHRRELASIRAAYGTTGLELTGSPIEVLTDSSIEMALDQRRIEYEGEVRGREGALRVLGLQDEQEVASASASNATAAGNRAAVGAVVGAGTSIAGHLGKVN